MRNAVSLLAFCKCKHTPNYLQNASKFKMEKNCAVKRSACPVSLSLDVIGDRWSLLILRDLMFSEKRTYGELQSSEEGIATNILAARLATLETNGIIYKTTDPENGRRFLYHLTEKGIGLLPVVLELMYWMTKHETGAHACGDLMSSFVKNKAALLKTHTKKLLQLHLNK